MDNSGLLVSPEFGNPKKYLEAGEMTQLNDSITKLAQSVRSTSNAQTTGQIVRKLLVLMNEKTRRLNDSKDTRKFKRTAAEILESGERTGCCDSSTLFVALARAAGIPAMQVITLNTNEAKESEANNSLIHSGHFFTACYLTDISGNSTWNIIDSNRDVYYPEDVRFLKLNTNDRNITNRYYAFAYANDFREIGIDGLKIDSIPNMAEIQKIAYDRTNKELIHHDNFER